MAKPKIQRGRAPGQSPSIRAPMAELAFDGISIEGGLLAADWLTRVAQLKAPQQSPGDYGVPKGLELRDEIGRYWRIAQAHWLDFERGLNAKSDPEALSHRFVISLLREAFGYTHLQSIAPKSSHSEQPQGLGDRSQSAADPAQQEPFLPISAFDRLASMPLVCAPAEAGLDSAQPQLGEGQRRRSAFGAMQDYLNSSEEVGWGMCADGIFLRVLRKNPSLTRPAWIELDLRSIFSGGLYPDFAAAWLLLHRSRFETPDGQSHEHCALEHWHSQSREEGIRARERLREGFEKALLTLGQGFLSHPDNKELRDKLNKGSLSRERYFGELLRLVYRLIFLLTVEERKLLHPPGISGEIQERYARGYSLTRLRERSARRAAHERHSDLWEALKIVFHGLAKGEPALGLPALSGLFAENQCPELNQASLDNRMLLRAIFSLCWLREPSGLARVNWRDMGPEELGSVYEGLLELVPQITQDGRTFAFAGREESRGNARKTSGSYYTPDSLVQSLLESALDPVIERTIAENPHEPHKALLELSVVDPACGSGHFLLAAARRLAEHVARLRSPGTPSPDDYRAALRQVVGRCLYGVDLNPLAVELCKVALWMEAIRPGMPLSFLDAHIQHGNALLGTSAELMGEDIPDAAWAPLVGDDRKASAALRKQNKAEREGQELLLLSRSLSFDDLHQAAKALDTAPDDTAAALDAKEQQWRELLESEPWKHAKLVHDAWCAAFMWPKKEGHTHAGHAPTTGIWRILRGGNKLPSPTLIDTVEELAQEYSFFHWELAFPTVFARGGFDVVLGNPPWERVKLQAQEFFAERDPEIAGARNAAQRNRKIKELEDKDPQLYQAFLAAQRVAEGISHFLRNSGVYPFTGTGDINTYSVFAERKRTILGSRGRMGVILPTGIATDATTAPFFRDLVSQSALVSLYDFENAKPLFPGVHRSFKFCLMVISGTEEPIEQADFAFFAHDTPDLLDEGRRFTLTPEEISLLNPNTGTCPVFRSRRDAEITLKIYRRVPVLINQSEGSKENPWNIRFMTMFHMSNDSHLFHTREELENEGWVLNGNVFERRIIPPPPGKNRAKS